MWIYKSILRNFLVQTSKTSYLNTVPSKSNLRISDNIVLLKSAGQNIRNWSAICSSQQFSSFDSSYYFCASHYHNVNEWYRIEKSDRANLPFCLNRERAQLYTRKRTKWNNRYIINEWLKAKKKKSSYARDHWRIYLVAVCWFVFVILFGSLFWYVSLTIYRLNGSTNSIWHSVFLCDNKGSEPCRRTKKTNQILRAL